MNFTFDSYLAAEPYKVNIIKNVIIICEILRETYKISTFTTSLCMYPISENN